MCTSRFQAWTVFMAQAQFRAQTKLGSVHLPSQRRQKWKSRLKISLFFPTTLFLIRQHRLAIANKLFAKQNLFQRIDSFASKNLNRSIKCQRNSLLSVPKKVRWCQIVANWKVTKFSGFRRKFFWGVVRPSPGICTARPDSRRRRQVRKRPAVVHIASHGCPKYLE